MRAAGLQPREPEGTFATVTERLGDDPRVTIGDWKALHAALADRSARAVAASLCRLADDRHSFGLEITNYRRARERGGGGGIEDDAAGEKAYRVSGTLVQNLDSRAAPAPLH